MVNFVMLKYSTIANNSFNELIELSRNGTTEWFAVANVFPFILDFLTMKEFQLLFVSLLHGWREKNSIRREMAIKFEKSNKLQNK